MTRVFDWLFVNQLFHTTDRGQQVFYPHGLAAGGYLVPPERQADVRAGVRRLVLASLLGTLVLVVIAPRLLEHWLGAAVPLPWFLGGAAVALLVVVTVIIRALSRLAVGLEAFPSRPA